MYRKLCPTAVTLLLTAPDGLAIGQRAGRVALFEGATIPEAHSGELRQDLRFTELDERLLILPEVVQIDVIEPGVDAAALVRFAAITTDEEA